MSSANHSIRVAGLLVLALLVVSGCGKLDETGDKAPAGGHSSHENLLAGYTMLADILKDEAKLNQLKIFKKMTLRGPTKKVGEIMGTIAKASDKRMKELQKLRGLSPEVSAPTATDSPLGDAILAIAKAVGKQEMLDREGGFDVRFVLLQAQATRMVAAVARAIAEFDPNAERQEWLGRLAIEYEGYRKDMIDVIEEHLDWEDSTQVEKRE